MLLMTCKTSDVAVCCSSDSLRSSVRCAQFLEQSRILDGNHGLFGKILDQLDLLVGERLHLLAIDRDDADQLVFLQHRHNHECAGTGKFGYLNSVRRTGEISRAASHVVYVKEPASFDDFGQSPNGMGSACFFWRPQTRAERRSPRRN